MNTAFQKLKDLAFAPDPSTRAVPRGLMDSLLQAFENRRPGLSDETLQGDQDEVTKFFVEIYEKEKPRLFQTVCVQDGFLSDEACKKLFHEIDDVISTVVIPAYVRLATLYTPRERNEFYLTPQRYHFIERFGWTVAGMILGAFIVWAPFIPIWSKEWILPFTILGLIFPNLRKLYSIKSYEAELNRTVAKAEREVARIELEYTSAQMTSVGSHRDQDEVSTAFTKDDLTTPDTQALDNVKIKGGN